MPEPRNPRAKTCGYCGRQLNAFFYRDLTRTRGFFCSGDHCMKFIENGKMSPIPGLREDEQQSVMDVNESGYSGYEERGKKDKKEEAPAPVAPVEEAKVEKPVKPTKTKGRKSK